MELAVPSTELAFLRDDAACIGTDGIVSKRLLQEDSFIKAPQSFPDRASQAYFLNLKWERKLGNLRSTMRFRRPRVIVTTTAII